MVIVSTGLIGPELDGGLLRKPEQKIRQIIPAVGSGEHERSAWIAIRLTVDLNAPEVTAPAHRVFAVVPDQAVRKRPGLVSQQLRIGVSQAAEVGERKIGQSPVKWVIRNAGNPQVSRNVLLKGIKVLCADTRAIEVKAGIVDHFPKGAGISDRHIETAGRGGAADARKRIGDIRRGCPVMKSKAEIVSRAALAWTGAASSQRSIHADVQVVIVIEC